MSHPANDDFSNRELSIEELETIAAGFMLGGAWGIGHPPPPPPPRPPHSLIYTGPRVNGLFF